MRAAIIGGGVVGSAVYGGLEPGHFSILYDIDQSKCIGTLDMLSRSDLVFICVPTPTIKGVQDTTALSETIEMLAKRKFTGVIVIKSTVLPGTMAQISSSNKNLAICHNPEFVSEKFDLMDFINNESILISGPLLYCGIVANFYRKFTKCKGRVRCYEDYSVTEWAKYMHNSLLPVKLSHLNELHSAIGSQEVYDQATQAIEAFGNIGTNHKVPGPDGELGWGGMCFPKDTQALLSYFHKRQIKCPTLLGAVITNNRIREKNDITGL